MPIQRPSEREQRPSALDVFTDREEMIAAFERNLAHKKPDGYKVLVFYGDGGIGKSTLLQKLEQIHRQRYPQALMGRLDLAGADTTPPDLLLYRLRRLFPTIPFPSFSLALSEYSRRFHPEQLTGADRRELLQGAGPYADALAGVLEVMVNMSGIGAAINVIRAAGTAKRQISDWVKMQAEPWLLRSQSLSEYEMLAQLPIQWAKDFRQFLPSQLGNDGDEAINPTCHQPLIILDTYETIWHVGMGKSGRQREHRERWLVDLVSELPEILWVIGGRDRLRWDEIYEKGWCEACEQFLLGQLSDNDARQFLAKRSIDHPAVVDKIVLHAAGEPFYLELEAQLFHKTPRDNRTEELFGGTHQQQIDRLLTHLDASERATLKLVSAFGIWDHDLFRQAVSHFATGYPSTGAEELARFWSIESIGEGRWQLHSVMAAHLQSYEFKHNNSQYLEIHRWGFGYYDNLLNQIDTRSSNPIAVEWLQNGLKHARIISPSMEWVKWFQAKLEKLGAGKHSPALLGLVENSIQQFESGSDSFLEETAILLQLRARLYRSLANYAQAERDLRQSILILRTKYGPEHPNLVLPINSLAGLMRHLSRYKESCDAYQESFRIQHNNNINSTWQYAKTLNDYALLLANQRNYSEAEVYYKQCLELKESIKGPRTSSIAITLNNLAVMYRDIERYQESLASFERALAIKEDVYSDDTISISNTLSNIGILYRKIGKYADAESFLSRALKIRISTYGPDHPIVAKSQTSLGKLYYLTSRLHDAEDFFRQSLSTKVLCLGSNHASVMESLEGLATTLLEKNSSNEAVTLFTRTLSISGNIFGVTNKKTISTMERIVRLLLEKGMHVEAKNLCRQQLELSLSEKCIDQPAVEKLITILKMC